MRARSIAVNGLQFESARAAARYIVEQEHKLGNARKVDTIAKELKRCWLGHSWHMYYRWLVITGDTATAATAGSEDHQFKRGSTNEQIN